MYKPPLRLQLIFDIAENMDHISSAQEVGLLKKLFSKCKGMSFEETNEARLALKQVIKCRR